jgi:peptidoglycan-N-acetylmuramic acid deacetylase
VDRREFLMVLAVGTAAALSGCTSPGDPSAHARPPGADGPVPSGKPTAAPTFTDAAGHRLRLVQTSLPDLPAAPGGPPSHITHLDGAGNNIALTIDDGISAEVVSAYVEFARATGVRFTFFVTGSYPSWTENKNALRPFVDSGQIQLANHTWTHQDLTRCSGRQIESELNRCEKLLNTTFGVTGKPFVRPPYGARNGFVDRVAASLGYTSVTTWYGSFGDSSQISERTLLHLANRWLLPQAVVIGHANLPMVTHLYGPITDIIRSRSLRTVTLDDAWYGTKGRDRIVAG